MTENDYILQILNQTFQWLDYSPRVNQSATWLSASWSVGDYCPITLWNRPICIKQTSANRYLWWRRYDDEYCKGGRLRSPIGDRNLEG